LARDLKAILERDPHIQVEEVQLFDFFPHTTHMEVLVVLRRR
jgi:tRNA/tmRNA/rRNA uracil-C5-methylase (TrmA/RlmC/RlmD family)